VKKRKVGTIKTVGTMRKLKKVPKFRSEHEEAAFWSTHDSTEYVDYSKAKRALGEAVLYLSPESGHLSPKPSPHIP